MSEGECVKVVVRCRPANTREKELKSAKVVKIERRTLAVSLLKGSEEPKTFTYDNVYDDDSLQKDVYDETAFPLVKSVMEGYNGTIFAYGQTGCGKTFTMEGIRDSPDLRGIIPRTFDQIFDAINTDKQGGDKKFLVAISYVEIYNEEVRDLLSDNPKIRMDVKEDPEKGVFIKNLSQPEVTSVAQIEQLMNQGNKNRSVGATAMNATSSRSHSLFTVRIETSSKVAGSDDDHIKAGKLNLVDLAGSERQSKTEATGDRLKEAQKINLSLSALGNVISALVVASGKGKENTFIPYRDSKLTRLLQDSLGGNTKTIMIAAVSPAADNYDETLSTLRYANRAKNIKNKPKVNEDPKDAMLREFQDEIKRLKAMLEGKGIADDGPEERKKKKKSRAAEESEEEEEEDDEPDRPKREKKPRKKREPVDGEVSEDDEIEDETDGDGRRKGKRSGLVSEKEAAKLAEQKADFDAELARINAEKEKHEQFARILEEQMAAEKQALIESMKAQTEAEKAAALQEVSDRLTRDKEEHEARAQELAAEIARNKAEEDRRAAEMAAQLSEIQAQSANEKQALKAKLKKLQQKMIAGGAAQQTAAQQAEEKARLAAEEAMALKQAEAREREERLRVEEEKLLLEESYSSIKDEVVGKTKKLKKLKKRVLAAEQEIEDSRIEWEREKEGYLANIRDSVREAKLYRQIATQLLTKSDLEKIVKGSQWQEEKDAWQLPRIDLPVFFPTVRLLPGQIPKSGAGAPPSSGGSSSGSGGQSRGAALNFNATAKFQEEKGTDSGWKKSVTAGLGGAAQAPAVSVQQPSASARITPTPPSAVHGPAHLRSMTGGSGPADSKEPVRRAAFDPAAQGSIPSADAERESLHAHLLNVMDDTRGRVAFNPADKSPRLGSVSPGPDVMDAAAGVVRKAAFSPGAGGLGTSPGSDVLDVLARNEPAKRAAFAPAGAAPTLSSANNSHDALTASLAASPAKRAAFEPAAKAGFDTGGAIQTSLPANLPAARSFQPATLSASLGGSSPLGHDDPLANAPPARPSFAPAGAPSPAAGVSFASLPSRPAFAPATIAAASPALNFPDTSKAAFKPAKIA